MTSHLKIPRHRADSLDHVSFADLYRRLTGRVFGVVHFSHRPAETTEILPSVGQLLPHIDVVVARIEAIGDVDVTVDPNFVSGECGWCTPVRPAVTSVRVTGDPADDDLGTPLSQVETCFDCAVSSRGPIWQALVEQREDSRQPIQVEVSE